MKIFSEDKKQLIVAKYAELTKAYQQAAEEKEALIRRAQQLDGSLRALEQQLLVYQTAVSILGEGVSPVQELNDVLGLGDASQAKE